ncbi:MAG: PfkB family carbohydrate kinase [Ilumatobacter sp.]|jgi:sulfofructose kinase|uniref:PfkB family carbohydrate kinase n=1 Tax=Ilumatobacter sp. TaxID=1967498 RepID=UPI00391B799C
MVRRYAAVAPDAKLILCAGSITRDHVYTIGEPLAAGQKHRSTSRFVVGGGVAANAAVTISRLGGFAALLGVVGADPVGAQVIAELVEERVGVQHIQRLHGAETPESIVIVQPDGARTIIAGTAIDVSDVSVTSIPTMDLSAVLVDARWPAATRVALDVAQQAGIPGVVDVDRLPSDASILDAASHLVFSEPAMIELVGSDDLEVGLRELARGVRAHVSVTLGARGVMWVDDDQIIRQPAFAVDVVDTTGAGDVFHGAFALALAEGRDTPNAFRFAAATAAVKCSRPGARAGIPNRGAVDSFLLERATTSAG